MSFSLTWMPGVLQAAGLKVATVEGWDTRGRAEFGTPTGVICHHTVGPRQGNMPSLNVLIHGRSDLPGPLAQLGLGRDGTYYVIAAGRCNHAGDGSWQGITAGNTRFIGIEAENTGGPDDTPWPAIQVQCYRRGVAAILKHIGRGAEFCAGHKEYALPRGRKADPDFDMNAFRQAVAGFMAGTIPAPPLIPATEEPHAGSGGAAGRPTLRRGEKGELVMAVQRKCGVNPDGDFGARTEAAVREFQRRHELVPDGIVGPKTWRVLDTE
jgi:peptidoglycan hydrolase-like protein with peptidoglycan-binding domain